MSQPDRHYQLSIKALDVPDRLKGAPVSVEIIPEHGSAQRTMLTLSDTASLHTVESPGKYFIRATLPSGRLIVDRATVPENTAEEPFGSAELDFGDHHPVRVPVTQDGLSVGRPVFRSALTSFGSAIRGLLGGDEATNPRLSRGSQTQPLRIGPGEKPYAWGSFDSWKEGTPTLVVRRGGSGVIDSNGRISAPNTNHNGRQILIQTGNTGLDQDVLVAWVADNSRKAATITPDPDGASYRSGAPCRVSLEYTEPVASSLFSYVRAGALEQARTGVVLLTDMLSQPGAQEKLGADTASMAAYVLQRFRGPAMSRIVDELADQYSDLADLHVIQGALRISEGKAETAAGHFSTALDKGVPCYTEGVRLMRDGLNFLSDLYPRDTGIRTNARRANCLAAAANFNSELTCLRLGTDITADFS